MVLLMNTASLLVKLPEDVFLEVHTKLTEFTKCREYLDIEVKILKLLGMRLF